MFIPKCFHAPGVILIFTALISAEPVARCADAPPAEAKPGAASIESSVVKIFSTSRYPDYFRPWTKQAPAESTGSGVVIEGKRILSNAHVVLYASQIQIQGHQGGDRLSAVVEAIAPEIDLAVLRLEDETFFATHPPLPRASTLPEAKDTVMVYGYPQGGATLSITKGIVSRIEFTGYNYLAAGLRVQIDAAINPGNSGGPAVAGDKMIGLAFSHLTTADNIGYIIPCEEIELFLRSIAGGKYTSKPKMFAEFQTLESAALRSFLKLDKGVEGLVVHKGDDANPANPLKEWDVISKVGDTPVDDQGMIKLGANLKVHFTYLLQKYAKDGSVPMTVVRDAKETKMQIPLITRRPRVISDLDGKYPSYFVYGPIVFTTASVEMVQGLMSGGESWTGFLIGRNSPLVRRWSDKPGFAGERMVVVPCPMFPHKLSKGYSSPAAEVVKSINGIVIKNLEHLVEVLRDSKDEFITVAFYDEGGETLVFPRAEMVASTEEILTDNGVRSQGSPDTLAIWNAKAGK